MSNWWPALPGPSVVYRPVHEWQRMAMAGPLRADDLLFDPVRGVWSRAADHPNLLPYFPQSPMNWPALLGLATLALLALAVARELANEGLRELVWPDLRREIFRRPDEEPRDPGAPCADHAPPRLAIFSPTRVNSLNWSDARVSFKLL